jgi:serine/threonine-protein kinase RsbW
MTQVDPDNEATFQVCQISSKPEEIPVPKKMVLVELKRHKFSQKSIFAIKLALEEALSNAIKHGNRCDCSKPVTVRYDVDDERAVIIVRDEGCGFEPEEVPDPTTPDRLPLPNGRGIMLMCAYMDEVRFRDHGREVYFVKYRKRPSPSS